MFTKDNYRLSEKHSITKGFYFDKDEKNRLLFFSDGSASLVYENIYYITYTYIRTNVHYGYCGSKKETVDLQKKEDEEFLEELGYFLEMAQKECNDFDGVYITRGEVNRIISYLKTLPWVVSAAKRILDNNLRNHCGLYTLMEALCNEPKKHKPKESNIRETVREEVDKYLKEIGLKKSIEFENDEIFLLSKKEYEKYKDWIPKINRWWWLRSSGTDSYHAAYVSSDGSVTYYGNFVDYDDGAVRPALKILDCEDLNMRLGEIFIKYKFPWVYLGDNLAIAEVPITFDKFDDKSNDYKDSYIRKFLKTFLTTRNVWKYKTSY